MRPGEITGKSKHRNSSVKRVFSCCARNEGPS